MKISICLTMAAVLTGCAAVQPMVRQYSPKQHFSPREAVSGSTSTEDQCTQTPDSVWVLVPGRSDCLRYYPSSKVGSADEVVVFLDGDKLKGPPGRVHTVSNYGETTPASLYQLMQEYQDRHHVAAIYLARPGTMGSSGNQNERRQHTETLEINAAIEQIKARFNVQRFALDGQSGGGGLVAALIAERSDVLCAVSSSGVTAVRLRDGSKAGGDPTGARDALLWDPIDQLPRVHPMLGFRMFVASDPTDEEVSFASQAAYVQAAKSHGLDITQIEMHGGGAEHHGLARQGRDIAAECMNGLTTADIVASNQSR
jgi:poly(3-hydroxybutyrate) depolymerase